MKPPTTPPPSSPEGPDRDEECATDDNAQPDPKAAIDQLCTTTYYWTSRASELIAKNPLLAGNLQWYELPQFVRTSLRDFLHPRSFHTDAVMARARLYFPNFSKSELIHWDRFGMSHRLKKSLRKFRCWLILDFCQVDPSLGDLVIEAGIREARELGCLCYFEQLLVQNLNVGPDRLKRLKANPRRRPDAASKNVSITPPQTVTNY